VWLHGGAGEIEMTSAGLVRRLCRLGGVLLLLGSVSQVSALDPSRSLYQYNAQTWRRANGLPANAVSAIAQTVDGKMWLGTSQGLVAFDGVGFRVLDPTSNESIPSKGVVALAPRPEGGLWLGLDRGGLVEADGGRFALMTGDPWSGPYAAVHALRLSRTGGLLVAGNNLAGALESSGNFQSLLPVPEADVNTICDDSRDRIWLGTVDDGVFYWENGKVFEFLGDTLRNRIVPSIACGLDEKIWLATATGLLCYTADFEKVSLGLVQSFDSQPNTLLVDSKGAVWIGTVSSGLFRYYDGKFSGIRKRDGLASDRILTLAESNDGSIWVGTEDGVTQLSDVRFPVLSTAEGLAHEACLSVTSAPDGSLWMATPSGASHYQDGRFTNYGAQGADGFTSRWIKRVFAARNGDVYLLNGRRSVDRFRDGRVVKTWQKEHWPAAVAEDARGVLVAFGPDLMRLENDEFVPFALKDGTPVSLRWIRDMMVAKDGSIWIAAIDGIQQIKDGVLRNLCHENAIYQSTFNHVREDDDGVIWAAQNTGIARIKGGKMSLITQEHGLHENAVYAIVPDLAGHFWMDSSRGIFRVSARELNAVADGSATRLTCTVYDGEDSVKTTDKTAQEFSGCRSAEGRIWFPSSQGVIMIDPASVQGPSPPPAVSIERVLINGREYAPDRMPKLEPMAGNLEFHYAALNYAAPLKTRYRYRLEGYETAWVDAGGRRSAFYTNLAHGRYRFHVQACNADGMWNTTGDAFALVLPARFYETLWFRVAWAAGAIALLGYIWWMMHLRRKHQELRQTHDLLEAKVQERTAELRAEIEEREKVQKEVERVHRELLEISRQAGMAEVATGVLHNVGNVLTSLNVSATLLHDRIRESKVSCVAQLRDLLRGHAADLGTFLVKDPRGRQVPDFVTTLADHLATEQAELMTELESLRKNVEHIRDIVAMQQNYARVSGVTERVAVQSLVEDALRMNEVSLARHAVELVRDYRADPVITVEKHKVLQILVNLLRNAKYACEESGRDDRRIVVRISAEGGGVQIVVSDNGVGISRENLTRIFSHGFTTKKSGHGFGLHNGALGAKNIGGSLTVNSEGVGKGATFVLELPEEPPGVGG
jgi:ligand-binding sensor domain-containing protein/signal transduction histidine kinase